METLIAELTNQSIKDVQDNDFSNVIPEEKIAKLLPRPKRNSKQPTANTLENLCSLDYDRIKYSGRSAGIYLDHSLLKAQSALRCPEHQNIEIQLLPRKELLFAQLNNSVFDNNYSKLDIGFSFTSTIFKNKPHAYDIATKSEPLPSLSLIRKACGLYFDYFDSFFPIVNKLKFDPNNQDILVHAVLAVSFQFAIRHFPELFRKQEVYARIYFRKVMRHLQGLTRAHMSHIQAALLMVVYLDMGDEDNDSVQWTILGEAIRMAQDIGLHRSCTHWDLPIEERENRHRTFYVCYVLDRLISSRTGKPLMILDVDFDTDLPLAYETNNQLPTHQGFLSLIQICSLLGNILGSIYSPRGDLNCIDSSCKDSAKINVLDSYLRHWKSETFALDTLSYAQKENLLVYYYTALLLLHRPFVESTESSSLAEASRRTCETAAYNILVIVDKNTSESHFPLPAFFVYAIFQSCLVHLALVLQTRDTFRLQRLAHALVLLKHKQKTQRAYQTVSALMLVYNIRLDEPALPPYAQLSTEDFFEPGKEEFKQEFMPHTRSGTTDSALSSWTPQFVDYPNEYDARTLTAWHPWPFISPDQVTLDQDVKLEELHYPS
ncbi:fungal-specific transcription factor domain-containing protein [Sporodiniella umbellata]|nr:fungal-specific transcription factor domain-containing protein [Sporodiniella umbellata]